MNLNEFLKEYTAKNDNALDVWCDWFCSEKALVNRTKNLGGTAKKIAKLIDTKDVEVYFKNCCPCRGGLYDVIGMYVGDEVPVVMSVDCEYEDYRFVVTDCKNDKNYGFNDRANAIRKFAEIFNDNFAG